MPSTAKLWRAFFLFTYPPEALLNPGAGRRIAMFRIAGILLQKLTGKGLALAAVDDALFLATDCHRAFSVEGMSICSNAATAVTGCLKTASFAAQTAPGIDHSVPHHTNPRSTGYVARMPVS